MRESFLDEAERGRIRKGRFASQPGAPEGAFVIGRGAVLLRIIVGTNFGWDHVSVSARRTPSWEEMCWVKDLFFAPEEVVMQLHPKGSEYICHHRTRLHLWRPQAVEIPTPPLPLV